MFRSFLAFAIAVSLLILGGCASAPDPIKEYTLARAAIDAARAVEAARYSPGYWHQAEESYRRGKILYDDHDFAEAKKEFDRARISAERAENTARLTRQKNGEVL
jgi:hypothetical protein